MGDEYRQHGYYPPDDAPPPPPHGAGEPQGYGDFDEAQLREAALAAMRPRRDEER